MKKMDANEFQANFDEAIKSVQLTGEAILVTKKGKPHVKVVRVEPGDRGPGLDLGKSKRVLNTKPSDPRRRGSGRNG
jgi:prevent-host-death family protein